MKSNKNIKILLASAIGLAVLLLDSQTAIDGTRTGLEICLNTVLPSLFPFVFLSSFVAASMISARIKWSYFFSRVFRIPQGAEGILMTGLLGGYPVGAKCIGEAFDDKRLTDADARRMLVFCNAAGPAFIFGVTGNLFQEAWVPWLLWLIHLCSAFCMTRLLPANSNRSVHLKECRNPSITERLRQSVKVMSEICAWIILMRVVISFIQKWLLWRFTEPMQVFLSGLIELSNGCILLNQIQNTGLRFILCSVLLGFGGLCVALQTGTTASSIDQRLYLPGKCVQAIISFVISYILQRFLFPIDQKIHFFWLPVLSLALLLGVFTYSSCKNKNSCGNLVCVDV